MFAGRCRRVALKRGWALLGAAVALAAAAPLCAQGVLQCAPYARALSGIDLHGRAADWWGEARGRYARGSLPRVGAVLAFHATSAMPGGHVAVVRAVLDARHLLLDHANWSGPGVVEHAAMAVDVSHDGDWSAVRVWYAPIGALGTRVTPAYGFIYRESDENARIAVRDSDG